MKIIIAFYVYLLAVVSGYARYITLENEALELNLKELIEHISGGDDGIRD